MMWKIIVLCTIVGFTTAGQITYKGYRFFAIDNNIANKNNEILEPFEEKKNQSLYRFREMLHGTMRGLMPRTRFSAQSIFLIAPHNLDAFYKVTSEMNIPFRVIAEDVQEWICEFKLNLFRQPRDSVPFDFTKYHTLNDIYANLDELAAKYPDKVQTIVNGPTCWDNDIKGVKVSFKANNPGIFIEGGTIGDEWTSPATVMYILHQLLTSNDANVRELAERHDWYIFPLFNPDAYEYTHSMAPEVFGFDDVDPYKNTIHTRYEALRKHPCRLDFFGCEMITGIEILHMYDYINSLNYKFYAYISFRGDGQILAPDLPNNNSGKFKEEHAIAAKAIEALKNRYGTEYQIKSVDYAALNASIAFRLYHILERSYSDRFHVYQYYLPNFRSQRLSSPDHIIPTGEEILDSLVALFKEIKAREYLKTLGTIP